MGDRRVRAPGDDELGPVADLAERRRARPDRLEGKRPAAPGSTTAPRPRRARPLGAAPRCSSGRARRRAAPAPARRIAAAASTASSSAHRAAVDPGDRRPVAEGEPRVAERHVRPSSHTQPHPAHVASAIGDHLDAAPPAAARPPARAPREPSGAARSSRRCRSEAGGDPLAGVRDVAHAALQPALAVGDHHGPRWRTGPPCRPRPSAPPRSGAAHRRSRAGARRRRRSRRPPRSPRATRSGAG